jgi:hypothetical protein
MKKKKEVGVKFYVRNIFRKMQDTTNFTTLLGSFLYAYFRIKVCRNTYISFGDKNIFLNILILRACGSVVEALCYKPEGCGFDSQ